MQRAPFKYLTYIAFIVLIPLSVVFASCNPQGQNCEFANFLGWYGNCVSCAVNEVCVDDKDVNNYKSHCEKVPDYNGADCTANGGRCLDTGSIAGGAVSIDQAFSNCAAQGNCAQSTTNCPHCCIPKTAKACSGIQDVVSKNTKKVTDVDFIYNGPIVQDISSILVPLAKILYYGGLFIGMVFIIIAGYTLMTSEGNPQRTQEGQEQLTAAILGIIFILLSAAILRVIITSIIGLPVSI